MRALQVILGVLVAIAGIYCCMQPVETQFALGSIMVVIMAIGMIVMGVGEILSWNDARKLGVSNGWTLFGGAASLILGIVLLCCDFFASGIVYTYLCAYMLAIWVIVGGISRIGAALNLRKLGKAAAEYNPDSMRASVAQREVGEISKNWVIVLILGILMILAGICCFMAPTVLVAMMGIILGISMLLAGISLVSLAIAGPK